MVTIMATSACAESVRPGYAIARPPAPPETAPHGGVASTRMGAPDPAVRVPR